MNEKSTETKHLYQRAKRQSTPLAKSSRLAIREDLLEFSNGEEKIYHVVTHPGACAILPIDSEGKLVLVKQYRYPLDDILIEIPAGLIENEEEPIVCARRELREEIGMNANELTPLLDIYTAPGFTNEKLYLFIAKGLYTDPLVAEDTDEIDIIRLPIEEAAEKIYSGEITDAKTVVSILTYLNLKDVS